MPQIPLERILEITIVAVVLYLVLAHADAFSEITRSLGAVYAQSVTVLQGR